MKDFLHHLKGTVIILFIGTVLFGIVILADIESEKSHKVSPQKALEVFKKIKIASGYELSNVKIEIIRDDRLSAFVYKLVGPPVMVITTGLLEDLKSESELAAIMGHEMSHYLLGHLDGVTLSLPSLNEMNADRMGIFLMLKAGYDVCHANRFWKRHIKNHGLTLIVRSHPSNAQRMVDLTFPHCK